MTLVEQAILIFVCFWLVTFVVYGLSLLILYKTRWWR